MKNSHKLFCLLFALATFSFFTSCEKEAIEIDQTSQIEVISSTLDLEAAINASQNRQFDEDCQELNFMTGFGSNDYTDRFYYNVRNNRNSGLNGTFTIQHDGDKISGSVSRAYFDRSFRGRGEGYIIIGEATKLNNKKVEPYTISMSTGYLYNTPHFGWREGYGRFFISPLHSGSIKLRTRDCSEEVD